MESLNTRSRPGMSATANECLLARTLRVLEVTESRCIMFWRSWGHVPGGHGFTSFQDHGVTSIQEELIRLIDHEH